MYEMSIEVLDGAYSASLWAEAHGDNLIEAAIHHGATDWRFHELGWGVVLELGFASQDQWDAFRANVAVEAALDAVPNPDGLLIYRGWGGSAWPREPRRPRPLAGAGAAALPLPDEWLVVEPLTPFTPRVLVCR